MLVLVGVFRTGLASFNTTTEVVERGQYLTTHPLPYGLGVVARTDFFVIFTSLPSCVPFSLSKTEGALVDVTIVVASSLIIVILLIVYLLKKGGAV
jgi:hypothetical protein